MNKKWTIKKKLLISTSILIFISVMIVTIISSRNYKKDMIELSYSDTKTTLTQLANNVETYLQGVQELCIIPYYDTSLIEALSMKTDSPSQILKRQRIIEAFLTKNILLPHDDIQDAYIYTDEELFSSNRDDNYVSSSGLSKEMINKVQNSKIPIIIYSNNDEIEILMFGPASVLPEFQKKGYGSILIEYSLEKAKELGFKAVAITGDPKYYSRFGFKEAKDFNVYYNDMKKDEEASFFMIKELIESYLKIKEGRLIEPIEYQSFDEEKFNNYDLAFPKKEKLVLETQLF